MVKKAVISIVDDDGAVREATMNLMKSLGLDSEAFQSAEEFLRSDRCRRTSCLIADVQMPGMTVSSFTAISSPRAIPFQRFSLQPMPTRARA